jgi:hypothetical protein
MGMKIMTTRVRILLLLAAFASAGLLSGCATTKPELKAGGLDKSELKAGGLYSIDDGEGAFRVVKILVVEDDAVHIAIYRDKFYARPAKIDPASLSFGSVDKEEEGIGMMHLPLAREAFMRDRPVFISQTSVTEEELEGYRMWKEAGGEVFP